MKMPAKKLKNGFKIPVLGLGTWQPEGQTRANKNRIHLHNILAIQKAIDIGFTRFDTAEIYDNGQAEIILGKGIKGAERKKMFITSKVCSANLRYDDVLRACEKTLTRLDLDYLDLYLIHSPNRTIPIAETMRALDRLIDEKMIKNIGVSNFGVEIFKEAQACTRNKIMLNQVHYNLIFREPVEKGLLDFCQKKDVILEAWRPLEEGSLANSGILVLDKIAKKFRKTQAQVAINWLLCQKNVAAVVKSVNPRHIKENFDAVGWKIDKNDFSALAEKFPVILGRSNAVGLQ